MQLSQIDSLADYLQRLRENPQEVQLLADDLLITVTNFFRDSDVFELLQKEIIPQLFKDKGAEHEVRIWSVGCATGEEALQRRHASVRQSWKAGWRCADRFQRSKFRCSLR